MRAHQPALHSTDNTREPGRWPTNLFVLSAALSSVTSLEGLNRPWGRLSLLIGELDVQTTLMGGEYIARGVLAPKS